MSSETKRTLRADLSFVREGRHLREWMLDLVNDNTKKRHHAGDVIDCMQRALPDPKSDWSQLFPDDWKLLRDRSDQYTRACVQAFQEMDQDGPAFLERLVHYFIDVMKQHYRMVDEEMDEQERFDAEWTGRIEKLKESGNETDVSKTVRKYVIKGIAREFRKCKTYSKNESSTNAHFMARRILDFVGTELLKQKELLWEMLLFEGTYSTACDILAKLGLSAREFVPFFLDQLDKDKPERRFHRTDVLAALIVNDAEYVDALITRLKQHGVDNLYSLTQTLEQIGPRLAGREAEVIKLLLEMSAYPDGAGLAALASVGRDDRRALERTIEWAKPHPTLIRHQLLSETNYAYDHAMGCRGIGLSALGYFTQFPTEVIPILLEGFESFEEYDPDETYHGKYCRICSSLQEYGLQAVSAVPRIIRYNDEYQQSESDEYPKDGLQVLRSIGPGAQAALPVLWKLRGDSEPVPLSELDDSMDVDQAILKICGQT